MISVFVCCFFLHPPTSRGICPIPKDVGLPLMMDEYWDDDTVFFVFEDDFRFEDEPPVPMSQLDACAAEAASSASTSLWAPRDVQGKERPETSQRPVVRDSAEDATRRGPPQN